MTRERYLPPNRDRALELVLALLVVAGGVLMGLAGLLFWGMKCDDACAAAQYASSWRQNVDAWQWTDQVVLALAITGASIVFAALLGARRRGAAWVLAAGLLGAVAWFALIGSG
jgi:hypothetical protein